MGYSLPDLLILAAATSYFIGYLIINQVMLRLFILAGTLCYIGYYWTVADTPLWMAIWASVAIGSANLFGLWLLLMSRSRLSIPKQYRALYDSQPHFRDLPPGDFRVLITAARHVTLAERTVLMRENAWNTKLYYLLDGTVEAEKLGHAFDMPAGIFMGEVAYLLEQPASATIAVKPGATVLEWDFAELRKRSLRKPRFKLALEAMISRDLSRKVSLAVAPNQTRAAPRQEIYPAMETVLAVTHDSQ